MSKNRNGRADKQRRREEALQRLEEALTSGTYADGKTLVPTGRVPSAEEEIKALKIKLNK